MQNRMQRTCSDTTQKQSRTSKDVIMPTGPIFTFRLDQKIQPGLVTVAKFDNDIPNLVAVTSSNKVHIHNLRNCENRNASNETTRSLNITQPIVGISSVRYDNDDVDLLLICSNNSVFLYNVHLNQDVFTREVQDGGNVVLFGKIGHSEVVLVGGNCSVQGFDKAGTETFWIVTGDNVRSLALVDVDGDGEDELIVGSDDYDIRIFKNEDLTHEITETQVVTHLLNVGDGLFAYTLANGTVGVYERQNRLWRVKSKNQAMCLYKYDINGDGNLELITGWEGGKIDGRHIKTGEVLFKDNFEHTIAGICEEDCTNVGRNDLVVISVSGEVRVYNPFAPRPMETKKTELTYEQETVRDLLERKQGLLLELKNYECNVKYVNSEVEPDDNQYGAIPAKTRLQTSIGISLGSGSQVPHVEVSMSTNNDTIIRAIIVFAEGIFKGETHVEHPKLSDSTSKLSVSLYPPRDVPIDIHIKALVGYKESKQFHVFELTRQLPRFAMYTVVPTPPMKTSSAVSFTVNERIQRVMLWINRNFLLNQPLDINSSSDLKLYMISLRDERELALTMDQSGRITIKTDNMALAGDLIQSLATYLNLTQLKSNANFPKEEQNCVELLEKLSELESVKNKLNLELSEKSNLIRNLLIRSEDTRLLKDWKLTKRFYEELDELNKGLRRSYEIRVANYCDTVNTVKQLNGIVQKASRLRFGKHKTDPVTLSRNAIATNNAKSLIKAIRTGEA
ncbi:hypothetical protein RUM44_006801 [Polyplax serrata]|uniref:Bardet-Biedl syndrome 2 protein homolog n=1 Tax=Polyplax serrata TaxID=468196 RepID=A0ABR1AJ60_POLSC